MADTNPTPDRAPAGHAAHLYDPDIHDNQIVAVYGTMAQAEGARAALIEAGIDGGAMELIEGNPTGTTPAQRDESFWGAVKSLFAPDEDALAFQHAIGRGHAMLLVHPAITANREHIIEVLEGTGPIDVDAKLEEWQQSGFTYSDAGQDGIRTETPTSAAAMGAVMAAGAGGAMMTGLITEAKPARPSANSDTGTRADILTDTGAKDGVRTGAAVSAPVATSVATPISSPDTMKMMQERLRIGKREVATGAVRVRSYVVERPVEEQVRLHEERINVRRTPVDRPATEAHQAMLKEPAIEARETTVELEDTTKDCQGMATPGPAASRSNTPGT